MRPSLPLIAAAVAACTDALPSPSTVDVLRVLALTTPTPEPAPGGDVTLRAVWFDPVPGRSVAWRWRLCDPGPADDPRRCARPTGPMELGSAGDGASVAASRIALAAGESAHTWVVWVLACVGAPAVPSATEDRLVCPSSVGSEAYRRITVRRDAPRNANPPIAAWGVGAGPSAQELSDGADVSLSIAACDGDCAPIALTLTPSADAAESASDGPESLLGSIYVSAGSVDPPRRAGDPGSVAAMSFAWSVPRVVRGAEIARVWAVLRDQRGGETARAVTLRAR